MKKAIICIDDEAIILMSIKQELRSLFGDAFVYETALCLQDAYSTMDKLEAEGLSLSAILTDWIIPNMRGEELIAAYHARYPLVPCLVVSGQLDDKKLQELVNTGYVKAVLQKPWHTADLESAIKLCVGDENILGKKQS